MHNPTQNLQNKQNCVENKCVLTVSSPTVCGGASAFKHMYFPTFVSVATFLYDIIMRVRVQLCRVCVSAITFCILIHVIAK